MSHITAINKLVKENSLLIRQLISNMDIQNNYILEFHHKYQNINNRIDKIELYLMNLSVNLEQQIKILQNDITDLRMLKTID